MSDKFAHATENEKQLLREFLMKYMGSQWFKSVDIVENHPIRMCRAMDITATYKPLAEVKDILLLAGRYNVPVEFTIVPNAFEM